MTLLESIVAFVVLALVGIACLDLSRGAVQLQRTSAEWSEAVRVGQTALAAASVGDENLPDMGNPAHGSAALEREPSTIGLPSVSRRPWRNDRAVDVVEVVVPFANGGSYRAQRLVRRRPDPKRVAGLSSIPGAERTR